MTILCLTGWQQEKDALKTLAPDALHFDYDVYDNFDKMAASLPPEPDIAIGWSLGGQLLVRAVAGGIMRPQKLVLLGVPFQDIADHHFPHAPSPEAFKQIKNHYINAPMKMLKGFQALIAAGDDKQLKFTRSLSRNIALWHNGLFWLEELEKSTCRNLDYTRFPETFILHGQNDHVIHPQNAIAFQAHIPHATLFLLPHCGHALHLHSPAILKEKMG